MRCKSALHVLKCDIKRCLVIFIFFHFSITVGIQCYLVSDVHLDPTYMRYKAITPVSHMHSAAIVSSLSHGGVMRGWEWAYYDVIKRPLALLL